MSRVVNVYNGDYKVAVQDGGNITLDTGNLEGNVIVTGNLEVKGTTTTVESTEVTITDNVIVLNNDVPGAGIPASLGYVSGIEIARGSLSDAQWFFDEQISWTLGGTSGDGTWSAKWKNGQRLPISTPGIVAGGNFYVNTGNGVISVTNTVDYEEGIWNYTNGVITPTADGVAIDDDHIPNARALIDYVDFVVNAEVSSRIAEGNTEVEAVDETHSIDQIVSITSDGLTTVIQTNGQHGYTVADTVDIFGVNGNGDLIENLNGTNIVITEIVSSTILRVQVDTTGGDAANYVGGGTIRKVGYVPSEVKITVSGINVASFYDDRLEVADFKLQDNVLSVEASNQDLEIAAPGTGSVKIRDVLELPSTPHDDDGSVDPILPDSGVKLWAKSPSSGDVGLYYKNSNDTSGELISKNRALLFSMLF